MTGFVDVPKNRDFATNQRLPLWSFAGRILPPSRSRFGTTSARRPNVCWPVASVRSKADVHRPISGVAVGLDGVCLGDMWRPPAIARHFDGRASAEPHDDNSAARHSATGRSLSWIELFEGCSCGSVATANQVACPRTLVLAQRQRSWPESCRHREPRAGRSASPCRSSDVPARSSAACRLSCCSRARNER